ncbi:unnamed protein product [Ilex paraguariensis]|uniref:Uncharacterized protein n=1 Tax=Ilex paraguariensis TaxID=185542 RepID=A0ABC8QVZ3_9AQUA
MGMKEELSKMIETLGTTSMTKARFAAAMARLGEALGNAMAKPTKCETCDSIRSGGGDDQREGDRGDILKRLTPVTPKATLVVLKAAVEWARALMTPMALGLRDKIQVRRTTLLVAWALAFVACTMQIEMLKAPMEG